MRRLLYLFLLMGIAGVSTSCMAQDGSGKEKPAAKKESGTDSKPDPFAVPEGNDEKILDLFLKRISRMPPAERTQEGILEHLAKLNNAVEEVLSREISEDLYLSAVQMRLEILGILPQLGDNTAVLKRAKLIDSLKLDQRPAVKAFAARMELEERVARLPLMPEKAQQELIAEVGKNLSDAQVDDQEEFMQAAQMAMQVAGTLERYGEAQTAAQAYKQYASILETKNHPQIGDVVDRMKATVRRLELLGNSIEIAGPTVSGGQFNIDQYKGKVVLVDFWATWCGPCIAELPNVKNLYDAYHDKGFEVIGISLDEDEASLVEFIKEKKLEWPTIFFSEAEEQGWNNPIARHYGISGIPTAILVNQQGKVVTLQARGENLAEELAKLLGPVEKPKAE